MLVGLIGALAGFAAALQVPLQAVPASINSSSQALISPRTEQLIYSLLDSWNSSGLAVAVVHEDGSIPGGWRTEFGSYGRADDEGLEITPDTLFAIASNSKLFLSISVGLLISNKSLAEERGQELTWRTKAHTLFPQWKMMDPDIHYGTTLQDMLSHRTGMPRHDFAGAPFAGGVPEMISKLSSLRPSAEFRETFQYNNMMFEAVSYLPTLLLNQSFESYVSQHIFAPLNMSSTYSVAEAEARGTLAQGYLPSMRDFYVGDNGTLIPTVPYFQRPGEERVWAGAGGILASARDLASWVTLLLNKGRHPMTNRTVIPEAVIDHVATGLTVSEGKASYPELSPKVYGCGQWRYSYQGHEIVEHGGHNPGYKTQVARFPNDGLAIISLSNDDNGGFLMEAVKWRISEEVLGLREIDWNERYVAELKEYIESKRRVTAPPQPPMPPSSPLRELEATFSHPTYGTIKPCFASPPISSSCVDVIQHPVAQKILSKTTADLPTFIVPFKRTFTTHMRFTHFSGNLFNVSMIWSNFDERRAEGYESEDGDTLIGLDERFEVEWVDGTEVGLAFKGNFWGKEGPDSRDPGGRGKESAEVWFRRDG